MTMDVESIEGQAIELLTEEVASLQATLAELRATSKQLTATLQEATESYFQEAKQEGKKRLASQTSNPIRRQFEHLQELKSIQKIFGFEIVEESETGVSAIFHHWYGARYIDNKSVAIEKTDDGQLKVLSHTLPLGSIPWLTTNLPCLIPHFTDAYKALRDMNSQVTGYFFREQQLQDFKQKYSDVDLVYTANLSSIVLGLDLCDTRSQNLMHVSLELLYNPGSPFPDDCKVFLNRKRMGVSDEEQKELIALIVDQFEPFKNMELAEAFFFCVLSKDMSSMTRIFKSL